MNRTIKVKVTREAEVSVTIDDSIVDGHTKASVNFTNIEVSFEE